MISLAFVEALWFCSIQLTVGHNLDFQNTQFFLIDGGNLEKSRLSIFNLKMLEKGI